jgi:hypothetical protein
LAASSWLTGTVTEVLVESSIVLLHSGCSRCVPVTHCAIDHVKACLPLVQPQLEAGTAASGEVLCPPLNVEDAVGRGATDRSEYTKPAVYQIQVVPIREDRVVVSSPRQALVGEGGISRRELRVAVGRQINTGKGLVVQRVREWQRDGRHRIVPMIADVRRPRHNGAPDLTDRVMV